jgi:hypothetical protein
MANVAVPVGQILSDPGVLYWAPLGTTFPAETVAVGGQTFTNSWDSPWAPLGPTTEGATFSYGISREPVRAAEFLDPLKQVVTERSGNISFALMDITLTKLNLALNGGVVTTTAATTTNGQSQRLEAPTPGSEKRIMIGWESDDNTTRIVLRQVLNVSELSLSPGRGANVATIPVQFDMEVPATGVSPFAIMTAGTNRA